MAQPIVIYECKDRVAHIRLNRPEKLNALNQELVDGLCEAIYRLDADDDAWVGIISGEGRSFCVGADVNERIGTRSGRGVNGAHVPDMALLQRFQNYKPVISAVSGHAYGAGFVIVLDSDLVVADETAKFQITEVVRGIDGTVLWARMALKVRGSFADDLALTGRICEAQEAAQVGLVNRLTPAGKHLEGARALAEEILALPPLAVRANVRTRRIRLERLEASIRAETSNRTLHDSADFRESVSAFKEKRKPVFEAR